MDFIALSPFSPWAGGSCLVTEVSASDNATKNGNHDNDGNCKIIPKSRVGQLCLGIGTALGDERQAFSHYADKYGTVQAYHGTKIESAWSTLNNGLILPWRT